MRTGVGFPTKSLDCDSLLPLSAMQPAASGAGQGFIGLFPMPMPSGSQQGCIAQKYSRL